MSCFGAWASYDLLCLAKAPWSLRYVLVPVLGDWVTPAETVCFDRHELVKRLQLDAIARSVQPSLALETNP